MVSLVPSDALEWRPQISDRLARPDLSAYRTPDEASDSSQSVKGAGAAPTPLTRTGNNDLLRLGDLLGHLLDCMAGFCALLFSLNPEKLGHFERLRRLEVNHFCAPKEALARMREYMSHIAEGFAILDDSDLRKGLPTVFVAEGEPVLTLLLGNLEHLINHKYQLFIYLRLMGAPLGTRDLYRLRGDGADESSTQAKP